MELRLKPELKQKVDEWTARTGRPADELVEEAMAGYLDELAQVRAMLDSRYDDLRSDQVQPIAAAEAVNRLREKSKAERAKRRI